MKFCVNCGAEMIDKAKFCPSCGTRQEDKDIPQENVKEHVAEKEPQNYSGVHKFEMNVSVNGGNVDTNIAQVFARVENKWQKVAYLGVGLAALGVIAPIISISSFRTIALGVYDLSNILAMIVIAMCGGAVYLYSKGRQEAMNIVGNAMILLLLEGYYVYKSTMDSLQQSMFGGFVRSGMVELEWGVYIIIAAIICIQLAGIVHNDEKSLPTVNELFDVWKNNSVKEFELFGAKLSSVIWTVILIVVISFVAYQSNIGKAIQFLH